MKTLFVAERSLLDSVQPLLTEDGVSVDLVEQPGRADFKVQSQHYDVVLLDRDRLGGHALSCLLRWRRDGLRAHVLVLLPGGCGGGERADALDAGADACLLQPLCPEELRAYLRALRRRAGAPAGSVWRVHDLEIDTVTRSVQRGGQPIVLTPREFDLLRLLAYRQGEAVSRAEIIEYLYDGEEITRNLVDVYIRYLRKKIDKRSNNSLILTCWGKGYMLRRRDG
jgi:DNA-binding response OmpR family regulator